MKIQIPLLQRTCLLAAVWLPAMFSHSLSAASITKASSGTDLTAAASWAGGTGPAPTSADVAVWDTGSLGAGLTLNSGTPSWLGILVNAGATDPINIGSGGTLTLGTSGINLSAAAISATINCDISLASGYQTWSVASGKTLAVNGTMSRATGASVNFPTANVTSTTLANNNSILGGWATVGNSGGTSATADWAANDGSGNIVAYTGYTAISSSGNSSQALSGTTVAQNWKAGAANGNVAGSANYSTTITNGGTINSLVVQGDFGINSGQTLALGSGGLILNGISRWILNNGVGTTAGTGLLTSGLGTGELFVDVPDAQAEANNWRIWTKIVDNGGTAVSLVKNGPGWVACQNQCTFSGAIVVNAGVLGISGLTAAVPCSGVTINGGYYVPGATVLNGNKADGATTTTQPNAMGSGPVAINGSGALQLGYHATSTGSAYFTANNITLNGGAVWANDAYQHLTGTLTISSGGGKLGSTYEGGTGAWNKGLFIDGVVSGSGPLTLYQSVNGGAINGWGNGSGNGFNASIVMFTNAANTYSGTITVTGGGTGLNNYLGVNAGTALQYATVNVVGTNSGTNLRWGTSPLLFQAGLGSDAFTLGALSGSGNVALTEINEATLAAGNSVALTVGGNNATTTYSGVMSGAGSVTKTGSGTLTLAGANTYTGNTIISAGTLKLGVANAIPSGSAVADNATLDLNTFSDTISNLSGNGMVDTVAGGSPVLTVNSSSGSTFSGTMRNTSGTLAFTKTGTGTLTLNGTLSYSGLTTVGNGKLVIPSSKSGTGSITLADGAALGVTVSGVSQVSPATLTLGSSSGATLEFNGIASTTTVPLNPAMVTVNGTVTVNVNSGTFTVGASYPLLANPPSGTAGFSLNPGPLTALGITAHLAASGGTLNLVVDSISDIWTGNAGNGNWDISSTANWTGHASTYLDGDDVLFDDSAPGTTSVTVSAQVNPGSMTVNNSAKTYTITSSGGNHIGGSGGLAKSGTGTLTLAGGNTYSGGTTLSAGQLNINDGGSSSANSAIGIGTLTIAGGTMDNTSAGDVTLLPNNAQNWNGSFTYAGSVHNLNLGNGAVALGVSPTVTVSTNTLTVGGGISGSGFGLTKAGIGTLTLAGNNSYTGGTTVSAGTLALSGDNSSATGATTVSSTLQLQNANAVAGSALTMNSGSTLSLQADANTTFNTASLTMNTGGNNNFLVNSLNSPAGNNHTLTIANNAGLGSSATTINVTSMTGDTLSFGSNFGVSANGSTAWGGPETAFNLSGANVILNGMSASDGGMSVNSTTGNTLTINGNVSYATARTIYAKVNSGTLILNDTDTGSHSGANWGFFANLNGGTLCLNSAAAINGNSAGGHYTLLLNSGTLDNTSGTALTETTSPSIGFNGNFTFAGSSDLNLGTGAVYLNGSHQVTVVAGTLTIGGAISDSGNGYALTKSGAGTLTLSGANTYTGNTTINGGTLALSGGGSLASSNLTMASGAVFDVSALAATSYALNSSGTLTLNGSKSGSTLTAAQLVIGSKNLAYNGNLAVSVSGDTLAGGDGFTLVSKTSGTLNGWFNTVTLPALSTGLAWDTNNLATSGVLDIYTFTTSALTLNLASNSTVTVSAAKLSSHASSSRGTPIATAVTAPGHGTAILSAGALTYTPATDYVGSDSFTLTYQDGHGQQTLLVNVTVATANTGPSLTPQSVNGYAEINTSGLPDQNYIIQISTNLSNAWADYTNVTSAANGVIDFTDSASIADHGGSVFYRLKQN